MEQEKITRKKNGTGGETTESRCRYEEERTAAETPNRIADTSHWQAEMQKARDRQK